MREKEITGLGKRGSGESDPVFPEEGAPDLREGMSMTPTFWGGRKSSRTDADKLAGPMSGNMPDIGNTGFGSEQEEALPSFGVPNFVRFTASELYEKTDTGTLLLSETEDADTSGDTGREDMTIDPNAATLASSPDDDELPTDRKTEKNPSTENRKENGTFSFDPGTVFAPGGNLDAISLLETEAEEQMFSDFPDIRKDREMLISELVFEQEETGKNKIAQNRSAFNPDAADIFRSRSELDFDFVRREDESEDRSDPLPDINAGTLADPHADDQTGRIIPPDETIRNGSNGREGMMPDSDTDRVRQFLSEHNPDKPQEQDADFLGAAFLTEIPEDEAGVDPDALTLVMNPSEFEDSALKVKEKTAEGSSGDNPAEKSTDDPFDLSDMLPEPEDEPVFDLDAQTVIAPLSDPGKEEEADTEDETILELGAEAIIESEDEIPPELGAEAVMPEPGEEYFDPDAETVVASAADILGLTSEHLLDSPSEADRMGRDEGMDGLQIQYADEGLPDLDSILDTAKADGRPDDTEKKSPGKKREIFPEEGLSAMDILNSMDSPEAREEYSGADDTVGMLDMLNAENAKQSVPEDAFFHMPDTEVKPDPTRKVNKSRGDECREIKADKKEDRITADIKDAAVHTAESEPLYDSLTGKYYFSLSPAQIEGAIERIINRVFSERIEKVLREVIGKAVEEEMKKFREGIMEDIAEGDKI